MNAYLRRSEHQVLAAIGRFRYMSAFQLKRLLYPNSLSYVQSALTALVTRQYTAFVTLPRYKDGGRNRRIYYLTREGAVYLKSFNYVYRVPKAIPSYTNLGHSLAINDVLVALRKATPFVLRGFQTEFDLKGVQASVCPDATAVLELGEEIFPLVIEVDNNTEPRKVWKDKIKRLAFYSQNEYRKHLNYDSLSIVVVECSHTPKRLVDLKRWTEQELDALGARNLGGIFFFASFDTDRDDLKDEFSSPVWHTPFSDEPVPLLS